MTTTHTLQDIHTLPIAALVRLYRAVIDAEYRTDAASRAHGIATRDTILATVTADNRYGAFVAALQGSNQWR